ncbi:MAG TPA: alkaline phosphatase family protein [Solirubrobacteraceae bacterium]|nr:alkaline phosphatase family protein [Solirubrobacteraceae bacterium]
MDHRAAWSTEPPSFVPAEGAEFINNVISVLRANPDVWRETVIFLNYDECDGYFDHVPPTVRSAGHGCEYLNPLPPAPPATTAQTLPTQEPGTRPRRGRAASCGRRTRAGAPSAFATSRDTAPGSGNNRTDRTARPCVGQA